MNDEELKRLEEKFLGELNSEEDEEQHIVTVSKEIAARLMFNHKIKTEMFDSIYDVSYVAQGNKIVIVFADPLKYKIAPKTYRPYSVVYEIENDLSMQENLACACEAFFRHEAGKNNATEMND